MDPIECERWKYGGGWLLGWALLSSVASGIAHPNTPGHPGNLYDPLIWLLVFPNAAALCALHWRYRTQVSAFLAHKPVASAMSLLFWVIMARDQWMRGVRTGEVHNKVGAALGFLMVFAIGSYLIRTVASWWRTRRAGMSLPLGAGAPIP